jgi:hypothetical protein
MNERAVGNATADIVPENGGQNPPPSSWNDKRFFLTEKKTGKQVHDIRGWMKGRAEEKSERNWKPDSTQGKVRRRNRHIAKFCRKFRKRNKGKNTDSLYMQGSHTSTHSETSAEIERRSWKCKFYMRKGKGDRKR